METNDGKLARVLAAVVNSGCVGTIEPHCDSRSYGVECFRMCHICWNMRSAEVLVTFDGCQTFEVGSRTALCICPARILFAKITALSARIPSRNLVPYDPGGTNNRKAIET